MGRLISTLLIFGMFQIATLHGQEVSTALWTDHPNIIFIMADDMGWGDPQCYNPDSQIPTSNIDRLATEGMRFTDAHAPASVCVPTRYGVMTGRYPMRMERRGPGPLIESNRMTVASLLQESGYRTVMIGKWHLGFEHEKNPAEHRLTGGPVDQGFDEYFGIPASLDIPPYYYIRGANAVSPPTEQVNASATEGWTSIQGAFWREGGVAPGFSHAQVTPDFASEAVRFLRSHREQKTEQPFFLYLALPSPHTPWLPVEKYVGRSGAGMYGDFTMQVDAVVGQVLDTLDALDLAEDTLIFFTSDNGPVWYDADEDKYEHKSTGDWRGMKGDAFEGGHRMPFLARWPGRVTAGVVSDQMVCHTDLLATCAAIVNRTLPDDAGEDSYSMLPILLGNTVDEPLREAIVHRAGFDAIRQGDWKLIMGVGSGGFTRPRRIEPKPGEPIGQLYNLANDPGETTNLYLEEPDVVARLTLLFKEYRESGRSAPLRAGAGK